MSDPDPVVVRPAVADDLDGIVEVAWQVGAEGRWIGLEVPFEREARRALLAASIGAADHHVLVGEASAQVVGYLQLDLAAYGAANLGMAIVEHSRGRGLGRHLLAQGIDWARQAGAHKVALEVWPDNAPAIALYQSAGFAREGQKRAHYRRRNGQRWDAVLMGLLLQPAAPLVRAVNDDDGWDLVALIGACWSEYPGCVMDVHGEYRDLLAPATAYAAKGGAMWVVDGPGGPMASVALCPSGPGVVELQKLYVARRERRAGVGRHLIALVEAQATARGATVVELWSDTRFVEAHRCYEALGYRPSGARRDLGDRSATVEFHYAKSLSPTAAADRSS